MQRAVVSQSQLRVILILNSIMHFDSWNHYTSASRGRSLHIQLLMLYTCYLTLAQTPHTCATLFCFALPYQLASTLCAYVGREPCW